MRRIVLVFICLVVIFALTLQAGAENNEMSRAEAIKLIIEILGYNKEVQTEMCECPFSDVDENDRNIIGYASEKRWIKGTENGLFCPDDVMTRECFLTVILRSLGYIDNVSFVWNDPYDRAFVSGIYPVKHEGEFTRSEAEEIIKRSLMAYSMYSPQQKKSSEEWNIYTDNLSYESSQMGKIEYLYDTDDYTIVIGFITGSPHGASGKGCVVYKADGRCIQIELPRENCWTMAFPVKVRFDENENMLYYTCEIEKNVISMGDSTLVLQEAGVFEYCLNLANGETVTVEKSK